MNTKIYLNKIKKVNPLALFAIGLVVGVIITYLYFQTQLIYQGKTAKDWSISATNNMNTAKDYSNKLSDLNKKYNSVSSALQTFLNAPTPIPKVQYINNTPSHPDFSTCTLQGDSYYCPSDECYYSPGGKQGACKIPGWGNP